MKNYTQKWCIKKNENNEKGTNNEKSE